MSQPSDNSSSNSSPSSAPLEAPPNHEILRRFGGVCPVGLGNKDNNASQSSNPNEIMLPKGGISKVPAPKLPPQYYDQILNKTKPSLAHGSSHGFLDPTPKNADGMESILDRTPSSVIPAAGRGNSEDGQGWLNPSPNQLWRACERKDKAFPRADAAMVSRIHEAVTNSSWASILEYEALHHEECGAPKLSSFEGKDKIYSFKARMRMLMGGEAPFDRHDWVVDRCGKEVKYIIDYYSLYDKEGKDYGFSIDARPEPTVDGMLDRFRLGVIKMAQGKKFW